MRRWHPLWHLFLTRLREFYREPAVLFWVYGFPLFLALGLGLAFSGGPPANPQGETPGKTEVDVQDTPDSSEAYELQRQLQSAGIDTHLADAPTCRDQLRTGEAGLVVVPGADGYRYVYDPARPGSRLVRCQVDAVVQRWKAGGRVWPTSDETPEEPGDHYIDFLIPGLMGMNLMAGGLWGVGYVIVDLRVRKLLKRLLATPMRASDFLLSILGSRLVCLVVEMVVLVLAGWLIFGVPVRGSLWGLALVVLAGAAAFAGLGLVLASRVERTETVSGLINLCVLPMWMLSGTFFSTHRFPESFQPVIRALPLTHLNNALRAVMLGGAEPAAVLVPAAILACWGVVSFIVALKIFAWR
jgi:ABC-2 type transport system permease protein